MNNLFSKLKYGLNGKFLVLVGVVVIIAIKIIM